MNVCITPFGVYECEAYGFTPDGKYMHTLIKSCSFSDVVKKVANATAIETDEHKEYSVLRGITEYESGVSLSFRKGN